MIFMPLLSTKSLLHDFKLYVENTDWNCAHGVYDSFVDNFFSFCHKIPHQDNSVASNSHKRLLILLVVLQKNPYSMFCNDLLRMNLITNHKRNLQVF